jgi:DNA-binding NtrC family response regulator
MPMAEFRWQALFQHVCEPLFVLDRKRRLVFVNRAWEELTGVSAAEARRWVCASRAPAQPEGDNALSRALGPPAEVLQGRPGRVRRRVAGLAAGAPSWWDVEFFPLRGADGLVGIVGKIAGAPAAPTATFVPLPEALRALRDKLARGLSEDAASRLWDPERLVALREQQARRFSLDAFDSPMPAVRRVGDQSRLASMTRAAVLLAGEPGTGREWLARAIHQAGPGRERGFAALDCTHLPPAALADALFGTGGLCQRPGIDTLYFKEPAHLPHDLQARLHDWLDEARQAGARDSLPLRPRILAGCPADPLQDVHAGRLLEKLYAVLATLVIEVPPLRARLADLPDLVDRLLTRLDGDGERRVTGLTPAAWELVREYRWPGNLRELYAVLAGCRERAAGAEIDVTDLPAYLRLAVRLDETPSAAPERGLPLDRLLEQTERRLIELALRRARGNKSRAAEMLAMWRQRLIRRMEALGMSGTEGDDPD